MKEHVITKIREQGILPLFYHDNVGESIHMLRTIYQAGIRVFEFTNRGTEATTVFSALKTLRDSEMSDLYLGIGTIKSLHEAQTFIRLGADFIVSPIINAAVGDYVHTQQKLWIPGCMTPSEIYAAQTHQAGIIKLFPANILGPSYLSAIKDLFKGQAFMPTGGVDLEINNLKSWFHAGVCAVGMGSKLINPTQTDQLFEDTRRALALIQEAR